MNQIAVSVNVPRAGADASSAQPWVVPASGPVELAFAGLATHPGVSSAATPDTGEQAQVAHALYAYPTVHHAFWRTVRGQARAAAPEAPLPPGCFDEHLALAGVDESQLWIGDLLRFPGCTLAVGSPRLPDARFNETLGFAQAAKMVASSRWCGFWLAVRVPGPIAAGDAFEVVPGPRALGVVELFRARTQAGRAG